MSLNFKEAEFFEALKKDYEERELSSVLYTMFLYVDKPQELLEYSANLMMSKPKLQLLKNSSDILFNTGGNNGNRLLICKNKDTFFYCDQEENIVGMGKEFHLLPAMILNTVMASIYDVEAINYAFDERYGLTYETCLKEYQEFCKRFNLEYYPNLDQMRDQSFEFEKFVKDILQD